MAGAIYTTRNLWSSVFIVDAIVYQNKSFFYIIPFFCPISHSQVQTVRFFFFFYAFVLSKYGLPTLSQSADFDMNISIFSLISSRHATNHILICCCVCVMVRLVCVALQVTRHSSWMCQSVIINSSVAWLLCAPHRVACSYIERSSPIRKGNATCI